VLRASSDSGGISTFSVKGQDWPVATTWVLQQTSLLNAGLRAINDHDTHFLIAPSQEMTLETYRSHLSTLNASAVCCDSLLLEHNAKSEHADVEHELALQSTHHDRATRFVYEALAAVALAHRSVPDWDENDFEYVAKLARKLGDGVLPLSALVWDPLDGTGGWTRERAFAAQAVSAHIAHEAARAEASGDEDEEAEVGNDNAYLRAVLRLDDVGNPFLEDTSAIA
jgi:hypothetical protein